MRSIPRLAVAVLLAVVAAAPVATDAGFTVTNREDCLCVCSCESAGFNCAVLDCLYAPDPVEQSEACLDTSIGPCVCRGLGCFREPLNATGQCLADCDFAFPPGTATPTPEVPATPTPTAEAVPAGENFFLRGDADCTVRASAADVVATVAGLGTESVCGNDDCDRDGALTAADVDCAARCIFGTCPVPPNAPRVARVESLSADSIAPFSITRITGSNFGSGDKLHRVTFGGFEAGVAGFEPPDALRVVVPPIEPGPVDVVVYDGDLAGAAFPLTVGTAQPRGDPDTYAATVRRFTDFLLEFRGLDLDGAYGAEAGFVRARIDAAIIEIEALLDDLENDPRVSDDEKAELDLVHELSGLPERLDALLQDIRAAGAGTGGAAGPIVAEAFAPLAGAAAAEIQTVAAVATQYGATLTVAGEIAVLTGGVAVVVGGVIFIATDGEGVRPALTEFPRFFDEGGEEQSMPVVDGTVRMYGRGIDGTVRMVVETNKGRWTQTVESSGSDELGDFNVYRLPRRIGLCGVARFFVERPAFELPSNSAIARIRPELLDVFPRTAREGRTVEMEARGVLGCEGFVLWQFRRADASLFTARSSYRGVGADPPAGFVETDVPKLPQGENLVGINVEGETTNPRELTYDSGVRGLRIDCASTELEVGQTTTCEAKPLPDFEPLHFPAETTFVWGSSDTETILIDGEPTGAFASARAADLGDARVTAEARSAGFPLADSGDGTLIEVVEKNPPSVIIATVPVDLPRRVRPGDTIRIRVEARDDESGVDRLRLSIAGDAAESAQQEFVCPLTGDLRTCENVFDVRLREDGFADLTLEVTAIAFDAFGNFSVSDPIEFSIGVGQQMSGVVRERAGGAPVGGAAVRFLDQRRAIVTEVVTSPDGRFLIDDPSGTAVTLSVTASGFRVAEQEVADGADVEVLLDALEAETAMRTGRVIRGVGRAPVAGATVTARDTEMRVIALAVTDGSGDYTIDGLPIGEYLLVVSAGGLAPSFGRLRSFTTDTREFDFFLYELNDECRTNLQVFDIFRAPVSSLTTLSTPFGEPGFGDILFETHHVHPDASLICLSGNPARPTVHWNVRWVAEANRRITTFSALDLQLLYNLQLPVEMGVTELLPPLVYGDPDAGMVTTPLPAPNLRSDGTPYHFRLNGVISMSFRLR